MAEHATINNLSLLGLESTPGTPPGSVVKQLQATSIEPVIQADVKTFGPVGSEFDTISQLTREWSQAKLTSEISSFTDIVYALTMWCDNPTPTTVGTTGKQRIFDPTDAPGSFTIDSGDPNTRAQRISYALLSDFEIEFSRSGISNGGTLFGQRVTDPITLGSPTLVNQVALDPNAMDFYVASTQAGLDGASALARGFRAMFKMSGRWNPIWPVGSANASFAAHVKRKPTVEFGLQLENDATGMSFLANLRANTKTFLRVKCTGPLIESGVNYLFQLDFSAAVKSAPDRADLDGADTLTWTFAALKDATWGKAYEFKSITALATL